MKNPEDRISLYAAINHPWFSQTDLQMLKQTEASIDIHKMIRNLKAFRTDTKFQKEVIKIMVIFQSDAEIKHIREVFRIIDSDHDGVVGFAELKEFMIKYDEYNNDEEITQLIQSMHLTDPTNLWYTEFIAAAIDKRYFLSKDKLRLMFQYFDLDNKGSICDENIKESFARCGNDISTAQVKKMINDIDPSADLTQISQDLFMNLMDEENFVKLDGQSDSENTSRAGGGSRLGEGRVSLQQSNNFNQTAVQKKMERSNKKNFTMGPNLNV